MYATNPKASSKIIWQKFITKNPIKEKKIELKKQIINPKESRKGEKEIAF